MAALWQAEETFALDKRIRSTSGDSDYTPPPACPYVKIEMIEEDLIKHVSELVDQNLVRVNRLTSANNPVYKVSMYGRAKVEAFLKTILPYVSGCRKRAEIQKLLDVCDAYNQWILEGGRKKAAQFAARKKAEKYKKSRPG